MSIDEAVLPFFTYKLGYLSTNIDWFRWTPDIFARGELSINYEKPSK